MKKKPLRIFEAEVTIRTQLIGVSVADGAKRYRKLAARRGDVVVAIGETRRVYTSGGEAE